MANQLKMAQQQAVIALALRGWSYRRIARELGVHRETVARYVRLAAEEALSVERTTGVEQGTASEPDRSTNTSKPANLIAGSSDAEPAQFESEAAKPAMVITGSAGQRSRCEPFRAVIIELLDRGLSGQRIWQDLVAEHGFRDGYQSVQRFVRKLRGTTPLPFRRMECAPGTEAQVDFGTAAPLIMSEGKRRRPHLFRVVLSHSRKAYSEAVDRQTTDNFLRCLENAFIHFGGVPKTLVIDNLKAAVTRADWFDPELNPKILAFCKHYGTVILPTKVRTPRHKGFGRELSRTARSNAVWGMLRTTR